VTSTREDRMPLGAIVLRALLYAGAVALLVLYAPDDGARFIYVGF